MQSNLVLVLDKLYVIKLSGVILRIVIGADHAGYDLKIPLIEFIKSLSHEVVDVGAFDLDPTDDYPDYARNVAELVSDKNIKGIIVCGSGVGACVVANKFRGIRASVCHDTYSARQGVEHDDMNILCLGQRSVGLEVAKAVVREFVSSQFSGENRHQRRIDKISDIESKWGGI